jgi:DNA-binding ferritin-like protein
MTYIQGIFMRTIEELANMYVAYLRAIYLTHQNSHWITKGQAFYGDHLLFERIYKSSSDNADSAAERMIGLFGSDALDPQLQLQFIHKILEKSNGDDPMETSMKIEKQFLNFSQSFYDTVKKEGKLSLGLDDLVMSIASDRETAVYLLGQATKQSGSKFAARKTVLNRIAAQSFDPNLLQSKLMNRLMAVVPSYVQGKSDINVSVDMQNKKIWATIKLPTITSQENQDKIEKNFQQFAYSILPDNMKNFIVGVGFVMNK